METQRKTYYTTDGREQYKRRAFEADLLKLVIAIVAELVIFFIWFDGPARERYEILVHIALPIFIVLPIINYRYLIVVPFIAFLPDVARAIGIDISHSLVILPLVFLAACRAFYSSASDSTYRRLRGFCYLGESSYCRPAKICSYSKRRRISVERSGALCSSADDNRVCTSSALAFQ